MAVVKTMGANVRENTIVATDEITQNFKKSDQNNTKNEEKQKKTFHIQNGVGANCLLSPRSFRCLSVHNPNTSAGASYLNVKTYC